MHTYDVVVMTVKNVANISYYFVVYLCRLLFRYRRTCTRCVSVVDPRDNVPVSLFNGHFITVISVELIQFKHILFAAEKRGDSIHIAMMMKVVRCGVSQNDIMRRTRIMEQHAIHISYTYRSCIWVGVTSNIRPCPVEPAPPACSMIMAMGADSYSKRNLPFVWLLVRG